MERTLDAVYALSRQILSESGNPLADYDRTITRAVERVTASGLTIAADGSLSVAMSDAVNVKAFPYLAVGDGVSNDTGAIQAAITAAPSGGVVFLPPGRYRLTTGLVITKPLTVQGSGAGSTNTAIFGSAAWASVLETGTVLESPMTSGSLLDFTPAAAYPLNLRDLVIKGLGNNTRTTVGVTAHLARASWSNVILLNLYAGFVTSAESDDNVFTNLWVCGCETGISLSGTVTNQNTFVQTNGSACTTAIQITNSADQNVFYGGVLQGNVGWAIDVVSGEENAFFDFYIENVAATGGAIRVTTGDANQFRRMHLGTAQDAVIFHTAANILEVCKYSIGTVTFAAGSIANRLIGPHTGAYVDVGVSNWWIHPVSAVGEVYQFTATQTGGMRLSGGAVMNLGLASAAGVEVALRATDSLGEAGVVDTVNNFNYVRMKPVAGGTLGKIGFYNVTPVARQVLATGAGATVDNVITALQNLGLVKQA